ncbi:cardiolipin synthase [Prosthecobacter fusiformis]|uniref:Cardiolipin synthase n=1 Tax=Prosthecobacter fusiformis TaxID=48464 RepID=A0A4R7STG7_9BACT|nr:phospholipase D-like domain-containing protein [Prosthecobacter fusiformis]TDU81796.1 cardiolipin synthase [Prosthecobacter fusiformis]
MSDDSPAASENPKPKNRRTRLKEGYFNLLVRRWGRLSVRGWLEVLAFLLVGFVIYSILFVKREVIEYRPKHEFAVSDPAFFGSAHAMADPVPIGGNKITLLHNGVGIFPPMLEAIRAAQKTINFEAFIFHSGKVGSQFMDAFCEQAGKGVKVRILLDGIGSGLGLKNEEIDRLRKAGCQVAYYHPARGIRIDRINRRTHRRVLVVDGKMGFTGGVGFGDEWQGNADAADHWREVHGQLEGPIVAKLQTAFQQHWLEATEELLSGADHFPALPSAGPLMAQVITSRAFTTAPLPVTQAVAIAAAEKSIYITNPYCTPTDDFVHLLAEATKRGVDVKLIIPGKYNDQPATKSAGSESYGKLLEAGVKIFQYSPTMIHSKTMVVDGRFSLFGTSNLDPRSSQINEEIDVSVYDVGFGEAMDRIFQDDLKLAKPYTMADFEARSLKDRFLEWIMIPIRSQL